MYMRLILALSVASPAIAQEAPTRVAVEREVVLGDELARGFRARHGTIDAPEAEAYLERIVGELAQRQRGDGPCCTVEIHTGGADAPYWPQVLPGGRILVPARRFLTASNERAFAWRLAHAIVHARTRDWATRKKSADQIASVPLIFAAAPCDARFAGPMTRREDYHERERLADARASALVESLQLGSGEFERARTAIAQRVPRLPAGGPAGRPSLLGVSQE